MDDGSRAGATVDREDSRAVAPGLAMAPAIPPLNVCGLVVAKADLVRALRLWSPQAVDLTPLDGERFLLVLAGVGRGEQAATE